MARVFVGNLPEDVRERDLSDKFDRFGRIASVRIKFPARPPPFAFIVRAADTRGVNRWFFKMWFVLIVFFYLVLFCLLDI